MARRARLLLAFEAVLFATASLVHAGTLLSGYEHSRAATAEGVIALGLLAGLVAGLIRSASARTAALVAQGFALLGTLVGAFTIAVGVGPQTTADYVFHATVLVVLVWGLVAVWRSSRD
jgi:hypothetical protein